MSGTKYSEAAPNLKMNYHVVQWKSYVCLRVYSGKYCYEFCSELLVFIELLRQIREQRSIQRAVHVGKTRKVAVLLSHARHGTYEGHLESKESFAIKKYLLIIGKKKNMQVLSHTFAYFST